MCHPKKTPRWEQSLIRVTVKPGFMNRWGPEAWFVHFMGGSLPSSQNQKYLPQGYRIEEVGPNNIAKEAVRMKEWEEKLRAERSAGCPFAFAK